jgi:transketolase
MATQTQPKFELKLGPATREAFGRALAEVGRTNKDIVVLDADLSKSTMTTYFAKEFPERFIECGIAESNMVAIAGGLAYAGKIPFVSSFSAFVVNKGFEQLRVVVAYPNTNVKVVGTHSGISIGEDGPSQMSVEEISLACSLPGFTVFSPCDEVSMKAIVKIATEHVGPVFIRAGRVKAPVVYQPGQKFELGKAVQLTDGKDVTIMATGLLVSESLKAAGQLEAQGISARVLDFPTIKPLDADAIKKAAAETGAIVVAEEHLIDGGLGVRVAQEVALSNPVPMEFLGLTGYAESGAPDQLLDKYGMRAANVIQAVKRVLARKK